MSYEYFYELKSKLRVNWIIVIVMIVFICSKSWQQK